MVLLKVLDVASGCLVLVRLGSLAGAALGRGFSPRRLGPSILCPGEEALQELFVVLGPLAHRQLGDLHLTSRVVEEEHINQLLVSIRSTMLSIPYSGQKNERKTASTTTSTQCRIFRFVYSITSPLGANLYSSCRVRGTRHKVPPFTPTVSRKEHYCGLNALKTRKRRLVTKQ